MFAIITRVRVEPDSIDELAALFETTNRALIDDEADWLGALFTANRTTDEVTVIARWADARSYQRLRGRPAFAQTMAQFSERFVGPPDVSVIEILVEM